MSERFAEAARGVLCTSECQSSHLNRLAQDARRERVDLTGVGRDRQDTIRNVVVGNGIERLRRGEVGGSWKEYTTAVVEESSPQVKSIIIEVGWLFGWVAVKLFWYAISWCILRIAEYVVESILEELFATRIYAAGETADVSTWVGNDPAAMIRSWEGMPCDGQ